MNKSHEHTPPHVGGIYQSDTSILQVIAVWLIQLGTLSKQDSHKKLRQF